MTKLAPPPGYDTWLDYCVAQMPTRALYVESCIMYDDDGAPLHPWPHDVQRSDFEHAARDELDELRRMAAQAAILPEVLVTWSGAIRHATNAENAAAIGDYSLAGTYYRLAHEAATVLHTHARFF